MFLCRARGAPGPTQGMFVKKERRQSYKAGVSGPSHALVRKTNRRANGSVKGGEREGDFWKLGEIWGGDRVEN